MNTTTNLPPQVRQVFSDRLLSTPTPNLIYSVPADKHLMPRNSGDTMRMSRYERLPTSPVPLGNTGVTPPSVDLTRVDIDTKISFYGQWTAINEQVTLTVQDPVLTAASIRLGYSLNEMGEDKPSLNTMENLRAIA